MYPKFSFACSPSLSPRVMTTIQSKNKSLVNSRAVSSKPARYGNVILVSRYQENPNMGAQNQRCSCGIGTTFLFFKVLAYGLTDVRTYSHVTTKIFEIDGLSNFCSRSARAPSTRRSSANTLNLKSVHVYVLYDS